MGNKPNNPRIQLFDGVYASDAYKETDFVTLRDVFANSAMQGMISAMYVRNETEDPDTLIERMKLISVNAYWYADQMLKQREL